MQPFVVKLNGLASGKTEIRRTAGREFFEGFGNSDILDASVEVALTLVNHGVTIDVVCDMEGWVSVPCDRCLEPLELPVETGFEEVYAPEGDELDLGQDVYDYVCTALPLQRIHPEGECNPETTKFLSK